MITVVGYKEGKEVRHERCYDVFSADAVAEDMHECSLYDNIQIIIIEEENGTK